jgi:hypothetical protein
MMVVRTREKSGYVQYYDFDDHMGFWRLEFGWKGRGVRYFCLQFLGWRMEGPGHGEALLYNCRRIDTG